MPSPIFHRSSVAVGTQIITGSVTGANTAIHSSSIIQGSGASRGLIQTTATGSVSSSWTVIGVHLTNNSATPAFMLFRNGSTDVTGQLIIAASGSLHMDNESGLFQTSPGNSLIMFQSQSVNVSGFLRAIVTSDA